MFSRVKSDTIKNKALVVISPTGEYILEVAGETSLQVGSMVSYAPAYRELKFTTRNLPDLSKLNKDSLQSIADAYSASILDNTTYSLVVKEIQAVLSNMGYPVISIYGISNIHGLYQYDIGFEIKVTKYFSIFCDFILCKKDNFGRTDTCFDVQQNIYTASTDRKFGKFDFSRCSFKFLPKYVPTVASSVDPSLTLDNLVFTPDLGIVIKNVYTDLSNNSFRLYEATSEGYQVSIAGGLQDPELLSLSLMEEAASINKHLATSGTISQGISNIADIYRSCATKIANIEPFLAIETSKNGSVSAIASYKAAKRFMLQHEAPPQELQFKLLHAATMCVNALSVAKVITGAKLASLLESLIGQQPSWNNNKSLHTVLSEDGSVIGFLPAGNESVIYDAIDDIKPICLQKVKMVDNIYSKSEIRNIAIDSLNFEEARAALVDKRNYYLSKMAAINLDNIEFNIKKIDEKVNRAYQVLNSLIASNELSAARAVTFMKAVEQIFKMPVKGAYNAISYGTLGEYIDVKINNDGSAVVTTRMPHIIPMRAEYVNSCGATYCVLEGDELINGTIYALVGSAYAQSLSDLNGHFLKTTSKSFYITKRQTRGSGKCEQEVVPETKTPERIVMSITDLITQAASFVNTLLNNDVVKQAAILSRAVASTTVTISKFGEQRKPYQEKLLEYFTNQRALFAVEHGINLIDSRFKYTDAIVQNADISYVDLKNSELEPLSDLNLKSSTIERINSISRGFDIKDDVVIKPDNSEQYNQLFDEINALYTQLREHIKDNNGNINNLVALTAEQRERISNCSNISYPGDTVFIEDLAYNHTINLKLKNMPETLSTSDISAAPLTYPITCYKKVVHINIEQDNDRHNDDAQTPEQNIDSLPDQVQETISIDNTIVIDSIVNTINEKVSQMMDILSELSKNVSKAQKTCRITHPLRTDEITLQSDDYIDIEDKLVKITYKVTISITGDEKLVELIPVAVYDYDEMAILKSNSYVAIGSLTYTVKNLLQQEKIFSSIPKNSIIIKKICYALMGHTKVDENELYNKLSEVYDNNIANYFVSYMSKVETLDSMFAALILAFVSNFQLCATTIKSFAGDTMHKFLSEYGIDPSSAKYFDGLLQILRV